MDKNTVIAPENTFRGALLTAAAVLYGLAALFGFGGAAALLLPGGLSGLTRDLQMGGITEASALMTWQCIHVVLTVVNFLCAGVLAVSLTMTLRCADGRGLDLLATAANWILRFVNISGIAALAVLIVRLIAYIISCLDVNEGVYLLYTMLISEALMVVQAWFLFIQLRRFLESLCGSALSLAYTQAAGRMESIPGFTAAGFFLLALFGLFTGLDRLLTLMVVDAPIQDYYRLIVTDQPLLYLSGIGFLAGAAGNVLMGSFLHRYKRTAERLLFQQYQDRLSR